MNKIKIIKKFLLALSIVTITISCEKETITQFNMLFSFKSINCYVASDMRVSNYANYVLNPDTAYYADLKIVLDFDGKMVSKGIVFESDDPNATATIMYIINTIESVSITSNKIFIDDMDATQYFTLKDYRYTELEISEPIGYSPITLRLKQPPVESNFYCFTIKITDEYDNYFEVTTDSIFIAK